MGLSMEHTMGLSMEISMKLSVCIITKNERKNLKKCLEALKPYPFELVVVDTGSTDGTYELARQFTDALYSFAWCDDFARAKNYAVSKASHDLVLVLDSDECVTALDVSRLKEQCRLHPDAVGRILRRNFMYCGEEIRSGVEYLNRLFDRRRFRYEGRVHEQLVRIDGGGADIETYVTGIEADHSGYLLRPEEKQKKAERNLSLLKRMLEDEGEEPYLLYQLGKSCYMAERYGEAAAYFGRALSYDLNERLEYVVDMVETYGYALVNSGQAKEALGLEGLLGTYGDSSDFWFLMGFVYMNNELFSEAVNAYEQAVRLGNARMTGADSFLAYYNAGVICECLGQTEAADYYEKAGDYAPARARLAEIAGK